MPIQFRCVHCGQMLSISSRKMGSTVNCPACTEPIRVPGEVEPTAQLEQVKATASGNTPTVPVPASSRPAAAAVAPAKAPAPASSPNLWTDEEEDDEDAPRGVRDSRIANDGLDMTPMVDVTFQLLIFFMITASFVTQKSLQTSAPEPEDDAGQVTMQVEEDDQAPVIVAIAEDGSILIDDFPVEPQRRAGDLDRQDRCGKQDQPGDRSRIQRPARHGDSGDGLRNQCRDAEYSQDVPQGRMTDSLTVSRSLPQSTPLRRSHSMALLEVTHLTGDVERRDLYKRQPMTIGSHSSCDLRIDEKGVERIHCRISWNKENWKRSQLANRRWN